MNIPKKCLESINSGISAVFRKVNLSPAQRSAIEVTRKVKQVTEITLTCLKNALKFETSFTQTAVKVALVFISLQMTRAEFALSKSMMRVSVCCFIT